jgi:hypothetical protein
MSVTHTVFWCSGMQHRTTSKRRLLRLTIKDVTIPREITPRKLKLGRAQHGYGRKHEFGLRWVRKVCVVSHFSLTPLHPSPTSSRFPRTHPFADDKRMQIFRFALTDTSADPHKVISIPAPTSPYTHARLPQIILRSSTRQDKCSSGADIDTELR